MVHDIAQKNKNMNNNNKIGNSKIEEIRDNSLSLNIGKITNN